jgi:hypothetical protein
MEHFGVSKEEIQQIDELLDLPGRKASICATRRIQLRSRDEETCPKYLTQAFIGRPQVLLALLQ